MNTLTAVAPAITADRDALRRDFPLKQFAIRHKLAGHPLLTLPRIAQLASACCGGSRSASGRIII